VAVCKPILREREIAAELRLWLDLARAKDLSQWIDDWLRFAAHMIEAVEHMRDISAEDAAKAMNSPPRFPLPTLEELG
jgi:hypothetical protein